MNYFLLDIEFLKIELKLLPLVFTMIGCFFATFLYLVLSSKYYLIKQFVGFINIYTFFNKKWYFDRIYNELVASNMLGLSLDFFYVNLDRGLIEIIGPTGLTKIIANFVEKIHSLQSGLVFDYIFTTVIAFLMLFSWAIL